MTSSNYHICVTSTNNCNDETATTENCHWQSSLRNMLTFSKSIIGQEFLQYIWISIFSGFLPSSSNSKICSNSWLEFKFEKRTSLFAIFWKEKKKKLISAEAKNHFNLIQHNFHIYFFPPLQILLDLSKRILCGLYPCVSSVKQMM